MDYDSMTTQELETAVGRLQSDLEDLEEMTSYHFANSAEHINAQEVKGAKDRLTRLRETIAQLRARLEEA